MEKVVFEIFTAGRRKTAFSRRATAPCVDTFSRDAGAFVEKNA